ncbi:hypothetical protein QAD02_019043 [Eretmocerus hayati]|uniref:Uncharacterized protein n=1 Tax=Eretmocerus hayati TaxID=131215 RepID=A0ACC2PJN2_9HYME|nr:hypothetical protein QAD02_019043 [Eretmocerus hayati]
MTFGTNFLQGDKFHLAADDCSRSCNASPEDGIPNCNNPSKSGSTKLKCPYSLSRLRVEKIEGGLMVAGVVIAANCQIALPVFGFLFVLVGAVLTAASYRGPSANEDPNSYAARIAFTGNSRVIGPVCLAVGCTMLALGALLCALSRRARRRERRVGFHCPLHGDFYPVGVPCKLNSAKLFGKKVNGWTKMSCWGRARSRADSLQASLNALQGSNRRQCNKLLHTRLGAPQCPHSLLSSTRSSLSGPVAAATGANSPISPCPTPMPFLVTSTSVSGLMGAGAQLSPDQNFGSIRSLSVSREIASFPMSRSPTPPSHHRPLSSSASHNSDDQPMEMLLPESPMSMSRRESDIGQLSAAVQQQSASRKSVSIVLPTDHNSHHHR